MYITKWCKKLKAALAVFSGFYLSSPKLKYTINKRCKRVFGSIFRLERNNQCSTFTVNIESSLNEHFYLLASKYILIPGLRCIPTVRGVCFKVYIVYLITFQSLSSTFKCNIFLTKILANAPLKINQSNIVNRTGPWGPFLCHFIKKFTPKVSTGFRYFW